MEQVNTRDALAAIAKALDGALIVSVEMSPPGVILDALKSASGGGRFTVIDHDTGTIHGLAQVAARPTRYRLVGGDQ